MPYSLNIAKGNIFGVEKRKNDFLNGFANDCLC